MQILEALAALDPTDDQLWTTEGLPRVEVVAKLVGHPVTRQQLTEAAPEFSHENLGGLPEAAAGGAEQEPSVGDDQEPQVGDKPADTASETSADPEANVKPKLVVDEFVRGVADECKERSVKPKIDSLLDALRHDSFIVPGQEDEEDAPKRQVEPGMPGKVYTGIELALEELNAEKAELDAKIQELTYQQSRLQKYAPTPAGYDHKADQEARSSWIQRQTEIRAARHGQAAVDAVTQSRTRAPIDAAMARKQGFGLKRPEFPAPQVQ